jgi:hypothetical protein
VSHRTPAAIATGERPGTAAMPSARAFANGSNRHSAGSRQSRGKRRPASVGMIASDGPLPSLPPPALFVWQSGLIAENRLTAAVPGFAKDLSAAGASSRWRSWRLPRSCRRQASHLCRASPMANPLFGALKASWTRATDRPAACAEFLILLRASSAASFLARRALPLQNPRISGMPRCHELEPRNTRTLVSSP